MLHKLLNKMMTMMMMTYASLSRDNLVTLEAVAAMVTSGYYFLLHQRK